MACIDEGAALLQGGAAIRGQGKLWQVGAAVIRADQDNAAKGRSRVAAVACTAKEQTAEGANGAHQGICALIVGAAEFEAALLVCVERAAARVSADETAKKTASGW